MIIDDGWRGLCKYCDQACFAEDPVDPITYDVQTDQAWHDRCAPVKELDSTTQVKAPRRGAADKLDSLNDEA